MFLKKVLLFTVFCGKLPSLGGGIVLRVYGGRFLIDFVNNLGRCASVASFRPHNKSFFGAKGHINSDFNHFVIFGPSIVSHDQVAPCEIWHSSDIAWIPLFSGGQQTEKKGGASGKKLTGSGSYRHAEAIQVVSHSDPPKLFDLCFWVS